MSRPKTRNCECECGNNHPGYESCKEILFERCSEEQAGDIVIVKMQYVLLTPQICSVV